MAAISPYETALELERPRPKHVKNDSDGDRVTAYWTYWDVFRNVPEAWEAVLRDDTGDEVSRRRIPTARTVIEATNRYLAKNPAVTAEPIAIQPDGTELTATPEATASVMKVWSDFAKREEFWTKFISLKRWMLIRGDGLLHLMADDTKPEGQRLRLEELDPSTYFTINDPIDPQRVTGCYIVTIVNDDEGEPIAQRQEYRKITNEEEASEFGSPIGTVFTRLSFWEEDGWDDREGEEVTPVDAPRRFATSLLLEGFALPAEIDTLPVYHFRNNREGNLPFGISEIQGIETLLAGIIQTATDEDITITLTGVGVYVTTSGKPRDAQGNEEDWVIAPASVIELESENDKFDRVKGVDTVQPLLDHIDLLEGHALKTTGTPDIAVGSVDVKVAESGIALSIQMAPILAKNTEKEMELKTKLDQMLYDIVNKWAPAYERIDPAGVTLSVTFDDPLPTDRVATLAEITGMLAAKIISIKYAQHLVKERLGYNIPAGMMEEIAAEQAALLDAAGSRLDQEAAGAIPGEAVA